MTTIYLPPRPIPDRLYECQVEIREQDFWPEVEAYLDECCIHYRRVGNFLELAVFGRFRYDQVRNFVAGIRLRPLARLLNSMARPVRPTLIPYDTVGVQPMTGPTGVIFSMRTSYKGIDTSVNPS